MRDLISKPVEILFLGTDWESVRTLEALNGDSRFKVVGVVTTVDKPVGRKQILTPSKVKEFAQDHCIEVFHTEKREEKYREALEKFKPELIVCKAFGEIVPEFFLEYPIYKAINVHFSILPKYRGAVPIQKAILDGEKETGITIMLMSAGMDEGDVLKIFKESIHDTDTNLSLRKRLVDKSADILGDVIEEWVNEKISPIKQDSGKATYCWQKDISKENAEIRWKDTDPLSIDRLVRAMIPWPVAWFTVKKNSQESISEKKIQIFEAEILNMESKLEAGTLFIKDEKVLVSTKDLGTVIRLVRFQIEGKKESNEKEFINGIGRNL